MISLPRLVALSTLLSAFGGPAARALDAFASPSALAGTQATVTSDNYSATRESGEPYHANNLGGASMWWSWFAPVSGPVTITTAGSNFDTLLAVYTGTALNALTSIAANNNAPNTTTSAVTFQAVAGTTYRIAVDGSQYSYQYGFGQTGYDVRRGNITLNLNIASPNDAFANAVTIATNTWTIAGSNVNATAEPGEFSSGGRTLWWKWVAPGSGNVSLVTQLSTFNSVLRVATGESVNTLTGVAGPGTSFSFPATGGTTYWIVLDAAATFYSGGHCVVSFAFTPVPPPGNDHLQQWYPLSGVLAFGNADTSYATRQPGEPNHGGLPGGRSAWWRWLAPAAGVRGAIVTVWGTTSTVLAIYTGADFATMVPVAAGRGAPGGASFSFPVQGGVNYWVATDRTDGTGGPVSFRLSAGSVANDHLAEAIPITTGAITLTGSTTYATAEAGEPAHGGGSGGHSVWWKWTPPEHGRLRLNVTSSAFTPRLGLYRGGSVATLAAVNPVSPSTYNVVGGQNYWIAVDSADDATGAFALEFLYLRAPTATYALAGGNRVGDTVTVTLTVGDPDGNFQHANFFIVTPGGATYSLLANSTLGPWSQGIATAVATTPGTHVRTFSYFAGPGQYIVQMLAFDTTGQGVDAGYQLLNVLPVFTGVPAADGDADGFGELAEYFLGLNPAVSDATGGPTAGVEGGEFVFRFNRAQIAGDVNARVLISGDLVTWTDSPVAPEIEASNPPLDRYAVRLPATTARLFARLELTVPAGTVRTVPVGYLRFPVAGGTLTVPATTAFGVSLDDPSAPPAGIRAGRIEAVASGTLTQSLGGWTVNLADPAAPWLVRLTSGPWAGRLIELAANTPTTLVVSGVDLTTLGLTAGVDTFELVPVDTLGSLFGGGTLLGGMTASVADQVQVRSGTSWLAYYFDTALGFWRRTIGPATNCNHVRIRPDSGVQIVRRGGATSLTFTGRAPVLPFRTPITNAATTVIHAGFPTDTTLGGLAVQTLLPGWRSAAIATAADQVALFSGTAWVPYFHNGSFWQPATGPATSQDARPVPAGTLLTIQRPGAAAGTTDLLRPLPYSP